MSGLQYRKRSARLKHSQNLAVHQPAREEFVINHVKSLSKNISPSNAQSIWKEIMAACRQIQGESNKVAYFGPIGTFTQQATDGFLSK